jgi:Phage integrase, N-terminal SAM-like domain
MSGADVSGVRVERRAGGWALVGGDAPALGLANDYLGYLADRRYSPRTVRAYAFDLLHFARWLGGEGLVLEAVTTEALLRYLAACRSELLPHQRGGNVFSIRDGRSVLRPGDDQLPPGGAVGAVCVPRAAGAGCGQSRSAGQGGAGGGAR